MKALICVFLVVSNMCSICEEYRLLFRYLLHDQVGHDERLPVKPAMTVERCPVGAGHDEILL